MKWEREVNKVENVPDWMNQSIIEATGIDRGSVIDEENIIILRAEVSALKAMLKRFENDVKDIKKVGDNNNEILNSLRDFYYSVAEEIERVGNRISNLKQSADPKLSALRDRISAYELAISQQEALKKSEQDFELIAKQWDKIQKEVPYAKDIKEHQIKGAQQLAYSRKAILADTMGLGKTLTSIATIDYIAESTAEGDKEELPNGTVRTHSPAGRRTLYLVPAQLDTNIQKEFQKWGCHRAEYPIFLSKQGKAGRHLVLETLTESKNDAVVIVNYEAWRKDKQLINDLIRMEFDTIVLDEAHYLKDRQSIAYRGVAHLLQGRDFTAEVDTDVPEWSPRLRDATGRPYDVPRYVYPMTGTPILNARPEELYTLLTLVDYDNYPATPAGQQAFLSAFCERDKYTKKWKFRDGGLDKLAEKIGNRYLRRTLQDAGIELPPQDVVVHELEIDEETYPEQAKARNEMRARAMLMLKDKAFAPATNTFVVRLRLRQIETLPSGIRIPEYDLNGERTGNYQYFNVSESQKLDFVIDNEGDGLLTEISPEQRTLVFSQFVEPLHELAARAEKAGLRVAVLDGKTPPKLKEEIKVDVDRYYVGEKAKQRGSDSPGKEDYDYDVVFANYKVGKHGLNFTHMTQMIILDEEWNPGSRDQAYDRQHRMGQTENMTVHVLRMLRSVDMYMAGLIDGKETDIEKFNKSTAMYQALKNGEM